MTDPLGKVSTWTYDAAGNLLEAANPLKQATRVEYDSLNRPILITNPMGEAVSYTIRPAASVARPPLKVWFDTATTGSAA
jgi:YD repeat-containing protein